MTAPGPGRLERVPAMNATISQGVLTFPRSARTCEIQLTPFVSGPFAQAAKRPKAKAPMSTRATLSRGDMARIVQADRTGKQSPTMRKMWRSCDENLRVAHFERYR